MPAPADTLGGVRSLETLRARLRAVDPFELDVAIAAAVRGRRCAIELTTSTPRATTAPSRSQRASSLSCWCSPSGAATVAARGGRSSPCRWCSRRSCDGFLTKNSTAPFVGMLLLLDSLGRYADARPLRTSLTSSFGSLVLTLGVEVGFEAARPLLALLPASASRCSPGRALRGRAPSCMRELREKAERAERERRRARDGGRGGALPHRQASCRSVVANGAQRHGRPGGGRAARSSRPETDAAPASGARGGRDAPAARRSARCAGCSVCCAASDEELALAPQPASSGSRRSWSEARDAGLHGRAERSRASRRRSRRGGPDGLPRARGRA